MRLWLQILRCQMLLLTFTGGCLSKGYKWDTKKANKVQLNKPSACHWMYKTNLSLPRLKDKKEFFKVELDTDRHKICILNMEHCMEGMENVGGKCACQKQEVTPKSVVYSVTIVGRMDKGDSGKQVTARINSFVWKRSKTLLGTDTLFKIPKIEYVKDDKNDPECIVGNTTMTRYQNSGSGENPTNLESGKFHLFKCCIKSPDKSTAFSTSIIFSDKSESSSCEKCVEARVRVPIGVSQLRFQWSDSTGCGRLSGAIYYVHGRSPILLARALQQPMEHEEPISMVPFLLAGTMLVMCLLLIVPIALVGYRKWVEEPELRRPTPVSSSISTPLPEPKFERIQGKPIGWYQWTLDQLGIRDIHESTPDQPTINILDIEKPNVDWVPKVNIKSLFDWNKPKKAISAYSQDSSVDMPPMQFRRATSIERRSQSSINLSTPQSTTRIPSNFDTRRASKGSPGFYSPSRMSTSKNSTAPERSATGGSSIDPPSTQRTSIPSYYGTGRATVGSSSISRSQISTRSSYDANRDSINASRESATSRDILVAGRSHRASIARGGSATSLRVIREQSEDANATPMTRRK